MIDFLKFCTSDFWKFFAVITIIYTVGSVAVKLIQAALTGLALMIWGPKK
jgi:hypothetical protein